MADYIFQPDIVLVRPWSPTTFPIGGIVEDSLGVGYLAASLRRANYKVAIIDAFTLGFNDRQVVASIEQLRPSIVAISLHSFADYKHLVTISQILTERMPLVYQIVGGEHATFFAPEILRANKGLHAVIRGEGEEIICEITALIMRGEKPIEIAGAVTRDSKGAIRDGGVRAAISNLDTLPFPEKDVIETALMLQRPVAISLLSGRGCIYNCTFCTAHFYLRRNNGIVWRRRDPKLVVDELESLVSRYYGRFGVHSMIQFQDVMFLGASTKALRWTNDFLDELDRRNLRVPFYIMAHVDAVLAHKMILPRLAKAGLTSVEIGIESGVSRILKIYNKHSSTNKLEQAIELLQANNICYDASGFIMFDPHMTLDEVRTNAQFLYKLGHATWDRYATKLQVFPGTEMRALLIREGLFDINAELDNVYAYEYANPPVGKLARHIYVYNEDIQTLDKNMHNIKFTIAEQERSGNRHAGQLRQKLKLAEDLYYSYFMALIDLAEKGAFKERFFIYQKNFFMQVQYMNLLNDLSNPKEILST